MIRKQKERTMVNVSSPYSKGIRKQKERTMINMSSEEKRFQLEFANSISRMVTNELSRMVTNGLILLEE